MRYATYTLRIMAPDTSENLDELPVNLSSTIQHAEDLVNDRLPDGFYCKIDESGEGVDLEAVGRLERFARGEH